MIDVLVRASAGGAIAVAVVWLIVRLTPRLSPAVRTTLWLLAAAKFLIGLVWISPIELKVLPAPVVVQAGAAVVTVADEDPAGVTSPVSQSWTVEDLAVSAWAVGALLALALGLRQWRRASAI